MLNFYTAAMEPRTERVALIMGCDPARQSRYAKQSPAIEVHIMRRADDADILGAQGYRWADWSSHKVGSVMTASFVIRAEFSGKPTTKAHFERITAGFDRPLNNLIRFGECNEMHRTLKRVDARMKTHKSSGNTLDMLIVIKDVLKSFGVTQLVGYKFDTSRGDLSDGDAFVEFPMRGAMDHVERIVKVVTNAPAATV